MSTAEWYEIKNIAEVDSPALIVFPERVKQNINNAITMAGNANRLRPHIKTHKSPDVTQLMIEAGITKFKCATIAEAEMLGQCGAKDVLLAYQPVGPKLKRFAALIKNYPGTTYSCLTDNANAAKEQSDFFVAQNLKVPVYIDLNIGMNRTGIIPGEKAIQLYQYISKLPGIFPAGFHAYDGHIHTENFELRTGECNEGFSSVEEMKNELVKSGYTVPVVIAGGTPTFPIHVKREDVECSPGTFVYWDKGYSDSCPEQAFLPAAVLLTRVISIPSPTRITTDLGHKSVAAENSIDKRVFFLNANALQPVGQSEEHLVLEVADSDIYTTGQVLYAIPYHICPTVALYEKVFTVENGYVTGEWKTTARDKKIIH